MKQPHQRWVGLACLAAAQSLAANAFAQDAIERIKASDAQFTCRAMQDEIGAMDKIMADAASSKSTSETAGTVADVTAQAAPIAAQAAATVGRIPGAGAVGQLLSPFASLFGGGARAVAQNQADKAGGRLDAARARKEYVSQLFGAAGCDAANLDAAPGKPLPEAIASLSQAAVVAAAPKNYNYPELVQAAAAKVSPAAAPATEGKVPEMFAKAPRIAVAGFRVAFVTRAGAQATAQSGLANIGRSNTITQAQNASIEISLAGVDPALMQAIADQAYADFMARLAKSGREVVPLEEILASEAWKELEVSKLDPGKLYAKDEYIVVSPSKIPLWFYHGEPNYGDAGMLALGNWRAMNRLSVDKNAVVVVPMVTIDFARVSSSGRTLLGSSAEVGAEAFMSLRPNLTQMFGFQAEKPIAGDIQRNWFRNGLPLGGDYGTVSEVAATDTSGLANALTFLTGTQGVQRRSKKLAVQVDPPKYAEKAMTAVVTANAAFTDALAKK